MKIAIPGGTGQVGTLLARVFHQHGHEVVVLARSVKPAPWRVVSWDPGTVEGWAAEIDGADVVINLAGRSVNCRYTPANRREIVESRVDVDRAVGEAIARPKRPPGGLAAGQHRHDLRPHVTTPRNDEVYGRDRRPGAGRPRHLALQHRGRQGLGTGAGRGAGAPGPAR